MAPWQGAMMKYCDLSGADLESANLRNANLTGAILDGTNMYGADMRWAVYDEQAVIRGGFKGALLGAVDWRNKNLHQAELHHVDLQGANMRNAKLRNACLDGANLLLSFLFARCCAFIFVVFITSFHLFFVFLHTG